MCAKDRGLELHKDTKAFISVVDTKRVVRRPVQCDVGVGQEEEEDY